MPVMPMTSVFRIVLKDRFEVLPAVEDADDGNQIAIYIEGDHCPFLVVGDPQTWPHVIALSAAKRGCVQALALTHDCFGVSGRSAGRSRLSDVMV